MNPKSLKTLTSSKNMNWCSPKNLIDLILKFGAIGLDPCSNEDSIVNALTKWFGPHKNSLDGLKESWVGYGLVYANVPYGRELPKWVKKAVAEAKTGVEIILLMPARPDTKAYQEQIMPNAQAICFIKGRLKFLGAPDPAPFPSMLVYFGPNPGKFAVNFMKLGWVITI